MRHGRKLIVLAFACMTNSHGQAVDATPSPGQGSPPAKRAQDDDAKGPAISGRILDGLNDPVSGVKVKVISLKPKQDQPLTIVQSGQDGRFTFTVDRAIRCVDIRFEKEGYEEGNEGNGEIDTSKINPDPEVYTLRREISSGDLSMLPYGRASALDEGVRQALASATWYRSDEGLIQYLFKEQASFRPAFRRLIGDPIVGESAKDWLDLLGDPGDKDLFSKGREYTAKEPFRDDGTVKPIEVREDDLVEAIKATARHVHFFSKRPEPKIDIDFITFTPEMDRALIQCWINAAPFTGIRWRFVFHKDGKRWIVRSMEESGRG